jgi:hypothetical protein
VQVRGGALVEVTGVSATGGVGLISIPTFVTGVSAEGQVGQILVWGKIVPDPDTTWGRIDADSGATWVKIDPNSGTIWTKAA